MSDIKDFVIEDGVLFEYLGKGGEVIIPQGVSVISENAFRGNGSITGIVVPEGVTILGSMIFSWCSALTHVTLPKSLTAIGNLAFFGCGALKEISFPDSLQYIWDGAFMNCKDLTCISIPSSVVCMGDEAFYGCESLTELFIPDSAILIGSTTFSGCRGLADENGFVIVRGNLYDYFGEQKDLIIPDSVYRLCKDAFLRIGDLDSLCIPASLEKIDNSALGGTNVNEFILPQNTSDSFGEIVEALRYETKLNSYNRISLLCSLLKYSLDYVRRSPALLNRVRKDKNRIMSHAIRLDDDEIVAGLFSIYKKISLDDLDEYISRSGDAYSCTAYLLDYKNRHYSESQQQLAQQNRIDKSLGRKKLSVADWKRVYTLKRTGEGIVLYDYRGNDSEIVIPSVIGRTAVIAIGDSAFGLSLMLGKTYEALMGKTMYSLFMKTGTYEYDVKVTSFNNLKGVVISEGIKRIGDFAFYERDNLSYICIPDSVTDIGEGAFTGCKSLTEISLPKGVQIGDGAFNGCDGLADEDGFVIFNNTLYHYCGGAETVTVPEGVTRIAANAFYKSDQLRRVILPRSVTSLGDRAFSYCRNLTDINISDTLTDVGDSVFKGCYGLKDIMSGIDYEVLKKVFENKRIIDDTV